MPAWTKQQNGESNSPITPTYGRSPLSIVANTTASWWCTIARTTWCLQTRGSNKFLDSSAERKQLGDALQNTGGTGNGRSSDHRRDLMESRCDRCVDRAAVCFDDPGWSAFAAPGTQSQQSFLIHAAPAAGPDRHVGDGM